MTYAAHGGRPSSGIWLRDDLAGMPTITRFRRSAGEPGWFVVADPAAGCRILNDGTVAVTHRVGWRLPVAVVLAPGLLGALLGAVIAAASTYPLAGTSSAGGIGGLIVGVALLGFVYLLRERQPSYRASVEVVPARRRAWRLCQIAVEIGQCAAWQDGTVDVHRQVPSILWSALCRAIDIEERRTDAEKALFHDGLRDMARESLERVDREERALDEVETNLNTVLTTARTIDERGVLLAREAERARQRQIEERELRGRLSGFAVVDTAADAESQADRSAGLVAEVETVGELLSASDRILLDIDPDGGSG